MDTIRIDDTLGLCNQITIGENEILKKCFHQGLELIDIFHEKYKLEKAKLPYHINLIDELHANENAHSRILVKLLKYNDSSDFTILKSFLKYLSKKELEFTFNHDIVKPKITAERHRIDALIVDGNYAVIIENKIHGAIDQPKQIQNYIDAIESYKIEEVNLFILYMTRWGTAPSEDSFPSALRERFASRFKQISYRHEIIDWLKNEVVNQCKTKEDFLTSALNQYVDHLEGMFQLREIDKPMKTELTKHLEETLKLDNDPSHNLSILSEKINDINQIKIYLDELIVKNYFNLWAQNLNADFDPKIVINELKDMASFPKVGLKLNYNGNEFDLLIEKDTNLYFGIAGKSKEDRKDEVTLFVKEFLTDFKPDMKWYGWKYTEYDKAYREFKLFAKKVILKINASKT